MKDSLRKRSTRSVRSGVICLGLLASTLGIGLGIANAESIGIGMPPPLSITHQPPTTIEPWLDLVLSFSVSGDCEGDPPGAYAYSYTYGGPETGLFVGRGCGPLSGTVTYDFGTGQSTVAATFAPRDSQGLRAGTVTIPGSGLPSGATLTYTINSRQSRTYTTTQGEVRHECLYVLSSCVVYLPTAPYVHGPTESDAIATASKSATIRISGDPAPNAPSAPTLSAAAGASAINLNWSAALPNGAPVTNYKIYRGESSTTLGLIATLGNVTTFNDNASKGITYYYAVSGLNSFGEGTASNVSSAFIQLMPQSVYSYGQPVPTGIRLSWAWSHANDGTSPVTKFRIYRDTPSGDRSLLTTINQVNSNNTFLDTQVADGKFYVYWVNAVSAAGEGPFYNRANAVRAYIGTPTAPVILTPNPSEGSVQRAGFLVSGTKTPGMTVRIYRDSVLLSDLGWNSYDDTYDDDWTFTLGWGLDGKAVYYARTLSPNGLESAPSNSITVDIDSVAPGGGIAGTWVNPYTSPDTFVGTASSSLISGTLNGVAWDNRSVREVRLAYYQSGTSALVREGAVTSCECGGPSATWADSPNLPPGASDVHLTVYDVAGNSSSLRRYSFTIYATEIP